MKLIKTKKGLALTEEQIGDLEKRIKAKLPENYKKFLIENVELNPDADPALGQQYENHQLKETLIFGFLYEFDTVIEKYLEYDYFENNRIDLYDNTVLIGQEINNGYFYLRVIDANNYEIGYWDSDYIMSDYQDEDEDDLINERMNPHNTYSLASSFSEFLNIWTLVQ